MNSHGNKRYIHITLFCITICCKYATSILEKKKECCCFVVVVAKITPARPSTSIAEIVKREKE